MLNLMTTLNKIKINNITYFFIISALITGMFKELIIIISILLVHELGHIFVIKLLKYEISYIEFLPFGGRIHLKKDVNSKLIHDFLIAIFGLLFQLLFYYIVFIFYIKGLIRNIDFNNFASYNLSIFIFNLLPIIPLDGYYICKSIWEKFLCIKKSFIICLIISFITLLIFFYINLYYKFNNYIIVLFLGYKFIDEISNYKYIYNRFLLERYLKNYRFKKIKVINKITNMSKERTHFFIKNGTLLKEKEYLNNWFDKRI